jgi:glycosyltransferase involved in cell wall biosynthesis
MTGAARVLIGVSVTSAQADRLRSGGPRRDFDALADEVGGTLVYQSAAPPKRGFLKRFTGPHIRQAWEMAREATDADTLFADGEHLGLPLLLFLQLRLRWRTRVVMLGHLPGRWWKRLAFRALTQVGPRGVVLVHSKMQEALLRDSLGRRWAIDAIPYQVDTEFWTRSDEPAERATSASEPPLFLAVGSEHRDYTTLARAVDGLPVRVVIAAGSHWARSLAGASELPSNVSYLDAVLDFSALREQYRDAMAVVVPLHDVPNQSGVTTILEAMSVGLPVIVTASSGQRECVTGPLVRADGVVDAVATQDRGQHLLGLPASSGSNGLYAAPGDIAGLRQAVTLLLEDADLRERLGAEGARTAREAFTLEQFVTLIAARIAPERVLAPARPEVVGALRD